MGEERKGKGGWVQGLAARREGKGKLEKGRVAGAGWQGRREKWGGGRGFGEKQRSWSRVAGKVVGRGNRGWERTWRVREVTRKSFGLMKFVQNSLTR